MIKPTFVGAQIRRSKKEGRTSSFLRRLILSTVDSVARKHYGSGYAVRCLQVSAAIIDLLARFEIASSAALGAVCIAGVYEDARVASWSGFWDRDHHVWVHTQFGELVDLGITQLHLHPASSRQDQIAVPTVWWEDVGEWPPVIRYLPTGRIGRIELPDVEDMSDLASFRATAATELERRMARESAEDIRFGAILDNVDTMNRLTAAGHPWLVGAMRFQDAEMEFPTWIQTREEQLRHAFERREFSPTF